MHNDSLQAINLDQNYIKAIVCNGDSLLLLCQQSRDIKQYHKGMNKYQQALQICLK